MKKNRKCEKKPLGYVGKCDKKPSVSLFQQEKIAICFFKVWKPKKRSIKQDFTTPTQKR